jgi:hypothetical protein
MKTWKISLITALSALGLLAAQAAHAEGYNDHRRTTVARPAYQPAPRYRTIWYRGRWVRRPIYVQPVYQQPVYQQSVYQQPVYTQPVYQQPVYQQPVSDNGCSAFAGQVRAELNRIEGEVRGRVQTGALDGNSLTAMESARDDILQDISDLSAKGYVTGADRAHVERDVQLLRQRFGCA